MNSVRAMTKLEARDPLVLARAAKKFYERLPDVEIPLIVDGLKSPAVLDVMTHDLGRRAVIIHVERPEDSRVAAVHVRADFDDCHDAERSALLESLGLPTLIERADCVLAGNAVHVFARWSHVAETQVPRYERTIHVGHPLSAELDRLLPEFGALRPAPGGRLRAAVLLLSTDRSRILTIRSTRTDKWTVPGGGLEPGESAQNAAVRELREESGIATSSIHGWCAIASAGRVVRWVDVRWPEQDTSVFAGVAATDVRVSLSSAHVEYRWMAVTDAAHLLAEPFRTLCRDRLGG
jgi:8-oxo-dGTP pyrophosphatase MutT (NUDIX family)